MTGQKNFFSCAHLFPSERPISNKHPSRISAPSPPITVFIQGKPVSIATLLITLFVNHIMGLRYRGTTRELNKYLPLTKYPSFQPQLKNTLPCEQRFLSCMPLSIFEVVRVSSLSRSQFVYAPRETFLTARKQTNCATDKPQKQLRQC